jgi:alkanesulfonate monooxygenase SsuD/methylene tetrahydromethanopterin reductase-like flavin-dependent oxidoreductase (luciferase family)
MNPGRAGVGILSGTTAEDAWRTDTSRGLTGILLTQRMAMSPEPTQVVRDFWAAAYDAIDG